MNITYVSQRTFPELLTGSEIYIHEIASYMKSKYSVGIIATGDSKKGISNLIYKGVTVQTFKEFLPVKYVSLPIAQQARKLNKQWILDLYSKPLNGFLHSSSWGFFSLSMKNYLESHNFEVIHAAAIPTATAWLSWRITKKRNIPFVFTPFLHYEIVDFKVPWVKELMKDSTFLIAVTNKEKEKFIEFGVNESKISVIPLGVDYRIYKKGNLNSFRKTYGLNEDLFVVLIPKKSKPKGTYDTLKALVSLSYKYNKLGLILLGSTSKNDKRTLAAYVEKLKLNGVRVIDLGFTSRQNLINAYQASDVIVEPSSTESFGLVYLEAWACGKPVIAADYGAISDIVIDGKNGLLVKFQDWKGIERALISLINDDNLKVKLGENGNKAVIEKYSIENMVQKTQQVYELVRT